jgi:hypothetical protein
LVWHKPQERDVLRIKHLVGQRHELQHGLSPELCMRITANADAMFVTRNGQFAGIAAGPCAGARFA